MTTIGWQGVLNTPLTEPGQSASADLTIPGGSAPGGASSAAPATAASLYDQGREGLASGKLSRTGSPLALALDGALRRLSERIGAFSWPSGGLTFDDSRLAGVPDARRGELSVRFQTPGSVIQEDKLLSRGFDAGAATSLAAGTYGLALGLGDGVAYPATDALSVTIGSGWTNGQVLDAVADAVNQSGLGVEARVLSQTGTGILAPDLVQTGSFLALSVNNASASQSASLADTSGHLAAWLDLAAPSAPAQPATLGTHQVSSLSVARPSTFRTRAYDPEATTTLTPGTYTVAYAAGPSSGSAYSGEVSITVAAGDTWGEVLQHMANVFGSASPAMSAQLVPAKRVWTSSDGEYNELVDGQAVEISARDPKIGWRLSLSGSDAASVDMLEELGLNATAQPGSDGVMRINGQDETRANNTFTTDRGRVVLSASATFGDVTPVGVSEPYERLAETLTDVVNAYNDLRGLMLGNEDILRPGQGSGGEGNNWRVGAEVSLPEAWRAPIASRRGELVDIGLLETGRDRMLWLSAQGFLKALIERPDTVRSALLGGGAADGSGQGLLPDLLGKARHALEAGTEAMLRGPESFGERDPMRKKPGLRTEIEVEKANQLLDLYDASDAKLQDLLTSTGGGALLRRRG